MTSSESEDFESADEDFDHSSKLKTDSINSNIYGDEPEYKEVKSSNRASENKSSQISSDILDLQNNINLSKRPMCSEDEKQTKSPEKVLEDLQQSLQTKKLGLNDLKLDDPAVVECDGDSIFNRSSSDGKGSFKASSDDSRPKRVSKKLGTKLAANFKTNNLSLTIKEKEDERNLDSRKQDKGSGKPEKCENSSTEKETKPTLNSTIKPAESFTKLDVTNRAEESLKKLSVSNEEKSFVATKTVDGWEIDEEDGFEIPVSLKKISDGSIQSAQEQQAGWSGWGSWGVGSLLSTATGSVSTFSSQVTAGLSNVLETTVGAPQPETLAAALTDTKHKQDREAPVNEETTTSAGYSGFGSIVSGVSFIGSTVINRGLDTLETLGKKTMEVLQEGDPGLMKKRAMLFPDQDKPVLSQILREAKEKADNSDKEKEEKEIARKAHFETLFDDFQGMVHLEALEMLSTQCELKLQSLVLGQAGPKLEDLQETMSQVQDLCELSDDDDETEVLTQQQFAQQVTKCVSGLNVNITGAKIIQVNDEVLRRLSELDTETAVVVLQTAISSLAEFTAAAMECFHKSAELLLAKPLRNIPEEADNYVQLTSHLCARVSAMANEFTQLLTKNSPIAHSSSITNIFLEASNSSSYMRNACQLLVPILQVGAVSS